MIRSILLRTGLAFLVSSAVSHSDDFAEVYVAGTGPWSLSLTKVSGVDRILFFNSDSSIVYYLDQSEATPTRFSLTYYTLKDGLRNPYGTSMGIAYTGSPRKIISVHLRAGMMPE